MMRHARDIPAHVLDNLDRLKEERQKYALTSGRFAEMIGVTSSTVLHYESGLIMPQRKIYNRMAMIFGWKEWKNDKGEND